MCTTGVTPYPEGEPAASQGFQRGLGSLWADTLQGLGGEFAQLPLITKAVVDDLKALQH